MDIGRTKKRDISCDQCFDMKSNTKEEERNEINQ